MHSNIKRQWVEALRSGEYKQGKGVLHNEDTNEYCCLGVLCDLAIKSGLEVHTDITTMHQNTPDEMHATKFDGDSGILPRSIRDWAGLANGNPSITTPFTRDNIATINDAGATFDEIADCIEEQL